MSERKRLLKLASRIDPTTLMEFLAPSEELPSGHFLVGDEKNGHMLCCWHVVSGLMTTIVEDDVFGFACERHLLTEGMVFRTNREAEEFAISNGWPGQRRYQ